MDDRGDRITRTSGVNPWRAGCGESRTSGSEGGPEKPTSREAGRALRSDPYTHFSRVQVAVTVVEDLVSRKWIADIVSAEETSTQIEIVFTDALAAEGLLAQVEARTDGLVDPSVDDQARPILLALSDNGPQMTSGSIREFMALCAIACHFGRPGTPSDQAWIESLFGHVKTEHPHLLVITDPEVLREELAVVRSHYNGGEAPCRHRLPLSERRARGTRPSHPQGSGGRAGGRPPPTTRLPSLPTPISTVPETRRCSLIRPGSATRTQIQTHVRPRAASGRSSRRPRDIP
jgi:hypothetical protein